jgi:CxxC motif-containing protein
MVEWASIPVFHCPIVLLFHRSNLPTQRTGYVNLTCIVCPNGCALDVERTAEGLVVRGNRCPRGEEYAREEVTDPHRTLTAVVSTDSAAWPCVPVKTAQAVPRESIPSLLGHLRQLRVALPVKSGAVIVQDVCGTGVAVVATRTLPPAGGTR